MEKVFEFEGYTIELVRKPLRRSLTIKLVPFKPIRVLANLSISESTIRQFLTERLPWIEKNLQKFSQTYQAPTARTLAEGTIFPLRGLPKKLRYVITPQGRFFFSETPDEILAHVPHTQWLNKNSDEVQKKLDRLFVRFYRHLAVRELSRKCLIWSQEMDLRPTKISFRLANARWGSCSSSGKISLNWKLICLPSEIQDYVVVHELSHLVHLNHSPRFWSLVEKYIPERKRVQKFLSAHQFTADFLGEPLRDPRI